MVKYVKANSEKHEDNLVIKLRDTLGHRADLIQIPDEFKDLTIDDVKDTDYRNSQITRTLIRNRTERSLDNYRVWRSHDRAMQKLEGGYTPGVFKISVAPATLIKILGYPTDATD